MGYRTASLTIATTGLQESCSLKLCPGALISASVNSFNSNPRGTQAFGRITIFTESDNVGREVFTLASSFVGNQNPLSWHGQQPISSSHFLVLSIQSIAGCRFRLSCYVLDPLTAKTGIPRDP